MWHCTATGTMLSDSASTFNHTAFHLFCLTNGTTEKFQRSRFRPISECLALIPGSSLSCGYFAAKQQK